MLKLSCFTYLITFSKSADWYFLSLIKGLHKRPKTRSFENLGSLSDSHLYLQGVSQWFEQDKKSYKTKLE